MGTRALRRAPWLGGALLGSLWLSLLAPACQPRDVYFFERDERGVSLPDAGAVEDEGTAVPGRPEPDPVVPAVPDVPAAFVQPACESEACERCLEASLCGSALPLCHPVSGQCVAGCDASEGDAPGNCPAGARCDAARAVCVECLTRDDCAAPLAACDVPRGSCVACAVAGDCAPTAPICDTRAAEPECVECVEDANCAATLQVCLESERRCVECESDADCGRLGEPGDDDDDAGLRCSPELRCVECLVDADCAVIEPDKPFCSSRFECEDERE